MYATSFRLFSYILAAGLGIWWYLNTAHGSTSLSPTSLGLVALSSITFVIFLAITATTAFTVYRVVILIIPFAVCQFLGFKILMWQAPSLYPAIAVAKTTWACLVYLAVMLAWIVLFPFPAKWQPEGQDGPTLRRLEWGAAALLASVLTVLAWYTMSVVSLANFDTSVAGRADLLADLGQFAVHSIRSQVLATYLFLLFRFAMRLEFAQKRRRSLQST
jgi:hypothetical protein